MSLAIACTPTVPVNRSSACRIDVTGADVTDTTTYDTDNYPTEAAFKYYLAFLLGGVVHGRSYDFEVASDGSHQFNSFIFDAAGSWTVELRKSSDDSVIGSQAVTVS